VPARLLEGFRGYLQTDGYDGYNQVVRNNQLTHVGCMAHAPRKFSEAVKSQGKNKKAGKAQHALTLIQKLYRVEKRAKLLSPEERFEYPVLYGEILITQDEFYDHTGWSIETTNGFASIPVISGGLHHLEHLVVVVGHHHQFHHRTGVSLRRDVGECALFVQRLSGLLDLQARV
jgi:hypothetical protein